MAALATADAPAPMATAVLFAMPAAPTPWANANKLPGTTLPMVAWIAAAEDPATTPMMGQKQTLFCLVPIKNG